MKTSYFVAAIEAAVREMTGQEAAFETVDYLDEKGEPGRCLGICIVKSWHFAAITARAAHWIANDPDAIFDHDADPDLTEAQGIMDALEGFYQLVETMRVAPYMQWTCVYFPSLTQEQINTEELDESSQGEPA